MERRKGKQRAVSPRRTSTLPTAQHESSLRAVDNSQDWTTASESEFTFAPHPGVRPFGLPQAQTSAGRSHYSPPPDIGPSEHNRANQPGVRQRYWQRYARWNQAQSRELLMRRQDPVSNDQATPVVRHRRASSASRIYSVVTTSSKRSVSSISSAIVRTASKIGRSISNKGKPVLQQVGDVQHVKQKEKETDKSTISRPLFGRSWFDEHDGQLSTNDDATGVHRADSLGLTQPHETARAETSLSRVARTEPGISQNAQLKRRQRSSALHDEFGKPTLRRSIPDSVDDNDDYQRFLRASAAQPKGRKERTEISSLVLRENSDDISAIINEFLMNRDVGSGALLRSEHNQQTQASGPQQVVPTQPVRLSLVQEDLRRITMIETGESIYFI